ncbi:hypothetical protein PICMEDRAFT_15814 [Pichia membranifaciens NRRL Y-2026]|uniref:Protein IFH1 n=1 Tax=Pichia membranifaciens NRRL Y-2026 TaxID=763406 RepID=A0A1E3NQU5_9ASCO|nr:hypothetical protein PICMEDRAFT_15814 [Pichia membranifaciens NRRL Y-2026]ODQ47943.1 hypothetical protein PICMEDRAFT_15814 [Pichia membranifaciens NRRL Y-2026]
MTESPRKIPLKPEKSAKTIAKKGPYATKKSSSRRFSIMSNSGSDSDSESDSESESSYDDHIYLNKNKSFASAKQSSNINVQASSGSDEEYSSSSDDENVDFVQLTKQRRLKAMKAVKSLKQQINETTSSISPSPSQSPMPDQLLEQEEPELDDDLVDAVIESEERKMKGVDDDNSNANAISSVADYSDAELNGDFESMNFDFSFEDTNDDTANDVKGKHSVPPAKDSKNLLDRLRDEDIGEVVVEDTIKASNSGSQAVLNKVDEKKLEIDVPKFNEKEINSDADYEFDNDDLIQTLLKDNDDLELQNLDNSDDDFDYLIANQHRIDQNAVNKSASKDLSLDSINTDDAYLMKEETQAMLDDFNKTAKSQASLKNRRSSMYYQTQPLNITNDEELDDLDLDLLNNFEQFLPKQQAMRRRSSILNQTLLSSSSDGEDINMSTNINTIKRNKKLAKKKAKKGRKLTNTESSAHTKDIRKMLGISNADSNFTSNYTSNAIVDSDDDTKLLEYIFEDSESDNISASTDNVVDNGNETDEDVNLPKKSGKILGSKHAKEILSSSKDQFRAPKLGTFITKKPYSVIDGFTTRFLQPLVGNHSVMQKAAAINKPDTGESSGIVNSNNLALDELINISEFDEDYSNVELKEDFDDFFGDKRIPLTAFRNKGLINNNGNTSTNELNASARRFSFTDRNQRRKHHKSAKSTTKSASKLVKPSNKPYKIKKASFHQPQPLVGALVPKSPTSIDTIDSSIGKIHDPASVDEMLLIGVDSIPFTEDYLDPHHSNFEITAPHQFTSQRKRKSMSRSSKARIRRASIVEAHAEGLRQTKNGLFDETIMDDVEALLIDMGDAEEYGFLFGNEV